MLLVRDGRTVGFVGRDKIYIGRRNDSRNLPKSPLANPFKVDKFHERPVAVELYRQWLWCKIKCWQQTGNLNPAVKELLIICNRVRSGEKLTLTCWCHPQPCHGDVIIRCVKWMISQGY